MNYYYDVILNWCDFDTYNFYEWNDTDYLELIKKIPLYKIKHKTLVDLMENKVKVTNEFLNTIKDKTLVSGKSLKKLLYVCLFTDGKNVIAIEFNEFGESINRSNLLIDDELNVLETAYILKEKTLEYEIINKISKREGLRQENEAKKLINLEINNLYKNKDCNKLKYLYYEYKKEKIDNIDLIYNSIKEDLEDKFNKDILKLYYIIKLSYHNV